MGQAVAPLTEFGLRRFTLELRAESDELAPGRLRCRPGDARVVGRLGSYSSSRWVQTLALTESTPAWLAAYLPAVRLFRTINTVPLLPG
jgi:hypothetical protein